MDQARAIVTVLPDTVPAVGVFNNPTWDELALAVERCGLRGVQLHGDEPAEFVDRLRNQYSIVVLKGLFVTRAPYLSQAEQYHASAYLVECGKGVLPGGNAMTWDWAGARSFAQTHPTALAGGLDPENVAEAIAACLPDAVDASSGLEAAPGHKDLKKVARFIYHVRQTAEIYANEQKSLIPVFR